MLTSDEPLVVVVDAGQAESRWARLRAARWTERHGLVVAGFCAVAFLLRVPTIGRAYWVDEAISVGIAGHPLRDLPSLLRADGSPPLWYVLLHFWMRAFGPSPIATHTLSLLISIAVVPIAYWAGRELFGRTAGVCAAALAATNPFLNWYATENRMYTLVVGLSLVAVTLVVRAVRDRSPVAAAGAVVALAAVDYTHNWGLYLTAVAVIYVATRAHIAGDTTLRNWAVGCGAGVFVLYLPWLPSFLEQAGNTAAPWAVAPGIGDLFADPATSIGGTLGFLVAPLLAAAAWRSHRQRDRATREAVTVVASITVATIAVGWIAANFEPSWTVRYLAVTVGPWLLGIAGALASSRLGRRVVVVTCVLLSAWSVVGNLLPDSHPGDAKDNVASVAAAAAPYLHDGDLVVVTQTEQVPVVAYYLGLGVRYLNPMGPVPDPTVVDWTHIISRLQQADACQTIAPAIDALPVGAAILEIDPTTPIGSAGSAWARAAHQQVVGIDHLLGHDPALQAGASFIQGNSPRPYSPVVGQLFVKVRAEPTCP